MILMGGLSVRLQWSVLGVIVSVWVIGVVLRGWVDCENLRVCFSLVVRCHWLVRLSVLVSIVTNTLNLELRARRVMKF